MIAEQKYGMDKNRRISINDLLICCFAIWPFFWNVWVTFGVTASIGVNIPLYFLWMITALVVLCGRWFKVSFLFVWLLFLAIVAIESLSRPRAVIFDLSVILCGVLLCIMMMQKEIDYRIILKGLYLCGLIVSLSVILDSTLGVFRNQLIHLYTEESIEVKLRLTASGGLLPYNASAGCFIYSGAVAYMALVKLKRNKLRLIRNGAVLLIFVVAALLIQKRGFIVDTAAAIAGIMVLRIRKENFKAIHPGKLFKTICYFVMVLIIMIIIYNNVAFVREAFDSLVERFTASDDTYSGRTDLYQLAFSLYKGHALTGIGWGQYRANTLGIFGLEDATYAVHNVYIQLLCETGIIGLSAFLIAAGTTIIYGIKKYRKFVRGEVQGPQKNIIELGIFLQLFFLAYCMSGNPLYDYNFCITYFIGILLTLIPLKKGT